MKPPGFTALVPDDVTGKVVQALNGILPDSADRVTQTGLNYVVTSPSAEIVVAHPGVWSPHAPSIDGFVAFQWCDTLTGCVLTIEHIAIADDQPWDLWCGLLSQTRLRAIGLGASVQRITATDIDLVLELQRLGFSPARGSTLIHRMTDPSIATGTASYPGTGD